MEQLFCVIGDPIAHSMSPIMHNRAFNLLGLSARYMAFHVQSHQLKSAIDGMRGLNIAGSNVTIPHKIAVMEYLDEIDELAIEIGAVNTIVNKKGKLIGYNTDGIGYVKGLKTLIQTEHLNDKAILILGAGGACRAIYFSLLAEGARKVDIANRTIEKANEIIGDDRAKISKAVSFNTAEKIHDQYDIIINTTSVGMSPNVDEVPIVLSKLTNKHIVSDIIYNPFETKLLKQARLKGALTQNGLDMFVYQGALAFELWTGVFPDRQEMKKSILTILGG